MILSARAEELSSVPLQPRMSACNACVGSTLGEGAVRRTE
jgi:hypothetical protein